MSPFEAEFQQYCETNGEPNRIELMLCDINAVLRGKWLPGDQAMKLTQGGVRLPLSTYAPNILGYEVEETGIGTIIGDPDGHLVPISGTLKPVPWAEGNVAQVLVEMTDEDGQISTLSSRAILAGMIERCAEAGFHPVFATELEFYIFQKRTCATAAPAPLNTVPGAQNYELGVLSESERVLTEILDAARLQGIPTDTLIAEYGLGQFEVNFHHTDDALQAADAALLFRRVVKNVVSAHGLEATFMAKPYADAPGNGMHVHASVLDAAGQNIFSSNRDGEVSENLGKAVAGVLNSMQELQAIFAPHLNSYRRFQPGGFAPTAPNWGIDHRGASVRLPEVNGPAARLEHRIAGADVNPYLVLTAILGGILHGLQTDLPLPPALDDDPTPSDVVLTHDWRTAIDLFEKSSLAAATFGKTYHQIFTAIRRNEIQHLTTPVTEIEYMHYLSRF